MQETFSSFLVSSTLGPVYASTPFTLNAFAQYTEFTALFDQYRIDRIEIWLEPIGAPSTSSFPCLTTCVDFDDATTPTSFASVEAHQNSLVANGAAGQYHSWQPRVALGAYAGTFTSFANISGPWIDSASPGVQHYGFKAATTASPTVTSYTLNIRALVSFRQPGI